MWIARNKDGELNLFKEKPSLENGYWSQGVDSYLDYCYEFNIIELPKSAFSEVTIENSPKEVVIKLKGDLRNG